MTIGSQVEATVETIAYGGDGVARVDGRVLFVPWTAPGDRVVATVTEEHRTYARGRLESVLTPSAARTEPRCEVFGRCGGCQLQHLDPEVQRATKALAVRDALQRIGPGFPDEPLTCEAAGPSMGYRQRAVLTWRLDDGDLELGYHSASSPARIVDVDTCPVLDPVLAEALATVRSGLLATQRIEGPALPYEGRVALRTLPGAGLDVGLFASGSGIDPRIAAAFGERIELPVTWGRITSSGVLELAAGAPRLARHTPYRGLDLRIGFDSFLQGNLPGAEHVYDAVVEAVEPALGQRVIDGYAGIGVAACELASAGAIVTAVEVHAGAASDLRANAARLGSLHEIHTLELSADRVDWRRPRPDVVLVNPPRGGCAKRVIQGIAASTASRLVYVSCDPATLARDVTRLGPDWRLDTIRVIDLFPQTAHVESVTRWSRVS